MRIFTVSMAPVNPPYDDGVKNILIGLARRLGKYRFYFVSSFFGRSFPREENVTFLRSAFQRTGRHSMSLLQKMYVLTLILMNTGNVDAFQFFVTPQRYFSAFFGRFLRKRGKPSIQVVSSVHTLYSLNDEGVIPDLFFADRVVVYSDYAKTKLEEMGVKGVVRIYPGIETARFEKAVEGGAISGDGSFKVIYPGTYKVLRDSYSFGSFCRMAENVIREIGDVRFVMACRMRTREDEVLRGKFMEEAQSAGILDNFVFLGTVEDMPGLIRSCDVGIMPATGPMSGVLEIPMVILEMAAAGKPVIYGNVRPLDELSGRGVGLLMERGDPRVYADRIKELLRDGEYASRVGGASREAVKKYFDIESMAKEYEKLYEEIGG